MGHKHGGQHNHGNPKQQTGDSPTNPLHVKLISGENEGAPKTDSHNETGDGKKEPPKKWRWPRWMGAPDWWIAGATIVLAVFAFASFLLLLKQLNDAREFFARDQRPWIVPTVQMTERVFEQQPVTGFINLSNSGKTPAAKIHGEFVIEGLKIGESPRFKYEDVSRTIDYTGIIYPNAAPEKIQATWLRFVPET